MYQEIHLIKINIATPTHVLKCMNSFINKSSKLQITQKGPSIEERIKNVVYPCNGILLDNEKKKVLVHAITWMNLKSILLGERGHT